MNVNELNFELKKVVKHFVKTNIKKIVFVDDIFKLSKFSVHKPKDDLETLRLLKKILQLTINVYNNFDIFKDFTFKFTREESNHVYPLNYFCNYDTKLDVWVCTCQPKEQWVTDALLNYILYFKSIEMKDVIIENLNNNELTNNDHCSFCDSLIRSNADICDICCAPIDDIITYSRKLKEKEKASEQKIEVISEYKKENKIDNSHCDVDNIATVIRTHVLDEQIMIKKEVKIESDVDIYKEIDVRQYASDYDADNNNTKINRVFVKGNRAEGTEIRANTSVVMNENRRKCAKYKDVYCMTEDDKLYHRGTWICRDCKRSENAGDNAGWTDLTKEVVSLSDHVVWSCDRCGSNSIDDNGECDNCRRIEDMKRGNIATVDSARWKCGSCKTMYPYNVMLCDTCQCTMVDGGLWLCESCTFENKFIDARCYVCFTENRHSLIRFCQICKEVNIGDNELFCGKCSVDNNHSKVDEGWWQCGFVDCGAWSNGSEDYCKNCGIWKNGFLLHNRGDLLKRMKHGASTDVWICTSCHRFNKFDTSTCGGWLCWAKRYEKKICDKCHKQNDGTSNYCKRCKVYL